MMKSVLFYQFASAFLAAALVMIALPVIGAGAQDVSNMPVEDLNVVTAEATHAFQVEVASTDRQRAQGLMQRETMPSDHGMLFVFDAEGDRYFWMKDTPLSLDIIFADADGVIVRIVERTTPFSQKIIPSRKAARFALEVNAGETEKLGVSAGDRLVSASISAVK